MTSKWKFKIGERVKYQNEHGKFVCVVAAQVMTGEKVAGATMLNTPRYSLSVETWDGGMWLGHELTPTAEELENQNP